MYFCWRGSQEGCTYSEICHLGQHYRSTHARQFESNRVSVVGASLNRADSSFKKQFGSGPCPCLHCKGACTRQGGERADRRPIFLRLFHIDWVCCLIDSQRFTRVCSVGRIRKIESMAEAHRNVFNYAPQISDATRYTRMQARAAHSQLSTVYSNSISKRISNVFQIVFEAFFSAFDKCISRVFWEYFLIILSLFFSKICLKYS